MNKILAKVTGLVMCAIVAVIGFTGCDNDVVKSLITPTAIETVAEYGTYFGSKAGDLAKKDAEIMKVSFEGVIKVIDANSVGDVIDISDKIDSLPAIAKKYIEEALNVVNNNFVKVKGKIPADKVPYVRAVFSGALKGIDKYIGSVEVVAVNSGYEVELANKYATVKRTLR